MASLKIDQFEAPDRGVDTTSSPVAMNKRFATELLNLLPGEAGRVRMRGPITDGIMIEDPSPTWMWTHSSGYALMPKNQGGNLPAYQIDVSDLSTIDSVNTSGTVFLREPYTQLGNHVFGKGFKVDEGLSGAEVIVRWTPNAVSPTLTAYSNGPENFIDITTFQNRLVVLGGEPAPGGGTSNNNDYSIYWSDIGGAPTDVQTAWQDDLSGLTNHKQFDGEDVSVALARCGQNLMICMKRSMWLITGTSPNNWQIKRVFSDIGVRNMGSIVETASGFYFLSDRDSYCFTDGVTWREVSDRVNRQLRDTLQGSREIHAVPMENGFLMLTDSGDLGLLFDTKSESWCHFHSPLTGFAPNALARAGSHGVLMTRLNLDPDVTFVVKGDLITVPEWASSSQSGLDFLRTNDGTGSISITARMRTRTGQFGTPYQRTQLNKFVMEYIFDVDDSYEGEGWYVRILDGSGNEIVPYFRTTVTTEAGPVRIRHVEEMFEECDDVVIEVLWSSNEDVNVLHAEIHDMYLVTQDSNEVVTTTEIPS